METKQLTCIGCPMGCALTVTFNEGDRESVTVKGNTCERGRLYAIDEVTNPTRTVTGTVSVNNRESLVLSVKTEKPVPKNMVLQVADELKKISVSVPIKTGVIVKENILNTGVNLIATKDLN